MGWPFWNKTEEMATLDNEPFLKPKLKAGNDDEEAAFSLRRKRSPWPVHLILIALYTAMSLAAINAKSGAVTGKETIDHLSLRHKMVLFKNLTGNPYVGFPGSEIDQAWSNLLEPMNIRVTEAELKRTGQNSVALPEGGGNLAWLGVFHELHCIKMLRQWNYRDYYHPNLTEKERIHMASHADHCFEMLRQAAICHSDLSLTTFRWDKAKAKPMFDASESVHECIDWEALVSSISYRHVEDDEIGRLINPLQQTSS